MKRYMATSTGVVEVPVPESEREEREAWLTAPNPLLACGGPGRYDERGRVVCAHEEEDGSKLYTGQYL